MPEHRYPWPEGCELRPAPVRTPRTGGISDDETCHENRRLKKKSEHGLHPVIPRAYLSPRIGRHHDFKCGKLTLRRLAMRSQTIRANSHGEIMPRFVAAEKPE
jgi:hypothetical protein